jgi:hypothetical protein
MKLPCCRLRPHFNVGRYSLVRPDVVSRVVTLFSLKSEVTTLARCCWCVAEPLLHTSQLTRSTQRFCTARKPFRGHDYVAIFWYFQLERSIGDVLQRIFYKGCLRGISYKGCSIEDFKGMFYRGYPTGDFLRGISYRGYLTRDVLRGISYRGFSLPGIFLRGISYPGFFYPGFSTGNVLHRRFYKEYSI